MAEKNIAVFGIYPHRASCEYALSALKIAGFWDTDISVLLQKNPRTKDLATGKTTESPEGTASEAGSGAVIGGSLGWLLGTGAIAVPGLGATLVSGPIAAALTGVGVGGTMGELAGALVRLGIPEYEARGYQGRIENGAILLCVHCDGPVSVNRAKQLLNATGAENVFSTGKSSADNVGSDLPGH